MSPAANPRLVLICGLPGAGKTTAARRLADDLPALRLCADEWMAQLGIDQYDEDAGIPVLKAIRAAATAAGNAQRVTSTLPSPPSASTFAASTRQRRAQCSRSASTRREPQVCMRHSGSSVTGRVIGKATTSPGDESLIDAGGLLPFEAYTDVASIVERYEELERCFPSAAFILTVRRLDD